MSSAGGSGTFEGTVNTLECEAIYRPSPPPFRQVTAQLISKAL